MMRPNPRTKPERSKRIGVVEAGEAEEGEEEVVEGSEVGEGGAEEGDFRLEMGKAGNPEKPCSSYKRR